MDIKKVAAAIRTDTQLSLPELERSLTEMEEIKQVLNSDDTHLIELGEGDI